MKNNGQDSYLDRDLYHLLDLVKNFMSFSDELLSKGMISQEQYDEITYNKIRFLDQVEGSL